MKDLIGGYLYDTHKAKLVWERTGEERIDYSYNSDAEIRTTTRRLFRTKNGRWFLHVTIGSNWHKYSIWTNKIKRLVATDKVKETLEPLSVAQVQELGVSYDIDFEKHGIPKLKDA